MRIIPFWLGASLAFAAAVAAEPVTVEVDGWIVFKAAEGEGEGLVTFSVDRFFVVPSGETTTGQDAP